MRSVFQVRVRMPVQFVCWALRHFTNDCFLSLEGNLSGFDPSLMPGASLEPSVVLRRNTTYPIQDFVILPATSGSTELICQRILPQVGLKQQAIHVQVASENRLVLGAFDKFQHVWIDGDIGSEIVSLREAGIIGWYEARDFEFAEKG